MKKEFLKKIEKQEIIASAKIPTPKEQQEFYNIYDPGKWSLEELEQEEKEMEMIGEKKNIFLIECGSKALILENFGINKALFYTIIINNKEPKVEGDTTAVYRKAKDIIQEQANKNKTSYHYSLETDNHKMAKWAASTGKQIFKWSYTNDSKTRNFDWLFATVIDPE